MANYIDPLDFKRIFINIFAGSPEVFTFIAVAVFSLGAGYFKMSNKVFLPLLGLFAIIFATWIGNALYVLTILITGLIISKGIAKLTK